MSGVRAAACRAPRGGVPRPRGFRHRVVGRAAQRLHRHVDLAVEVPQVLAVDLVLKLRHLLGGLVGVVHRQLVEPVELVLLLLHAEHDVLAHREAFVELRLLRQVAHMRAFGRPGLAGEILVPAGHDPQKRGFAGAVDAHDADLHAGQEAQADVLETLLAAGIGLGDAIHVVDVLVAGHGTLRAGSGMGVGRQRGGSTALRHRVM
jgi:hypothetical protein